MAASNSAGGVGNTFRRKFDREEYLERAREREKQEENRTKSKCCYPDCSFKPIALFLHAGYYCSVCECVVKDSANYLDHINGKKHQRASGVSMWVERESLEQVQERFEVLKKRKVPGSFAQQDLDAQIIKQQEEDEEQKHQHRERKKEREEEREGSGGRGN